MTKVSYQEKAINGLIMHDEDKSVHCDVCNKLYKNRKSCYTHIAKEHYQIYMDIAKAMKKESKKQFKEFCLQQVEDWFSRIEERYQKDKEKFLKDISENITYTLSWQTEEMIKKEKLYKLAYDINKEMKYYKKENPENWMPEFKIWLDQEREDKINNLLSSPHRHNSTSLMSNAIDCWEHEATANFVGGSFSLSNSIKELQHYVNKYLKEE